MRHLRFRRSLPHSQAVTFRTAGANHPTGGRNSNLRSVQSHGVKTVISRADISDERPAERRHSRVSEPVLKSNHDDCGNGADMLRSTFFAVGLFLTLWGVAFLFVDKVELKLKDDPRQEPGFRGFFARMTTVTPERQKVIDPPDWAAFSLMSIGAVTMLYAVALPKKKPE